ncbi:MAG: hypothetical protein KAR47_07915 [Planctomycetes bacterium]|nr:hypothetical protein [Planctomycetota bacterium]
MYVSESFAGANSGCKATASDIVDGMRGPFKRVPASQFAKVFECTIRFGSVCHDLFMKEYLYRSVWDFVKHLIRPSRARRAFDASIMLAENGLSSPEIIALGRAKYGSLSSAGFVLTRKVQDARTIYACLADNWRASSVKSLRQRRTLIRALGGQIGRMHSVQISHGDLRTGNILAEETNGNWNFCFLDNERTRKHRALPMRLRIKNLVQISLIEEVTRTDRLRFFLAYMDEDRSIRKDSRTILQKVVAGIEMRMRK